MLALIVSAALGQAASAGAPTASDPTEIPVPADTRLLWLRRPDAFDVGRVYPARGNGAAGRVMLRCQISAKGSLDNCRVKEESPEGLGFGASALTLARLFRIQTVDVGGGRSVVGMWMNLPIRLSPPR